MLLYDLRHELGFDGFGDVVGAAGVETSLPVGGECVGGQGDDGGGQALLSHEGSGLEAIHEGHLHVHENHVELL